jgi:hypothetical protein
MEGDSAAGTHVIPKYLKLKESLSFKLSKASIHNSLYPMYYAMLKHREKYLAKEM